MSRLGPCAVVVQLVNPTHGGSVSRLDGDMATLLARHGAQLIAHWYNTAVAAELCRRVARAQTSERVVDQQQVIVDAATAFAQARSKQELFMLVRTYCSRLVGASNAHLYLHDQRSGSLYCNDGSPAPSPRVAAAAGVTVSSAASVASVDSSSGGGGGGGGEGGGSSGSALASSARRGGMWKAAVGAVVRQNSPLRRTRSAAVMAGGRTGSASSSAAAAASTSPRRKGLRATPGMGLVGTAFSTGDVGQVGAGPASPDNGHRDDNGEDGPPSMVAAQLAVPVAASHASGKRVGVIHVNGRGGQGGAFDAADVQLVRLLAQCVTIGLAAAADASRRDDQARKLQTALEQRTKELARAKADAATSASSFAAARSDAARATSRFEEAKSELSLVRKQLDAVRGELDAHRARAEELQQALAEERKDHAAELAAAVEAAETAQKEAAAAVAEARAQAQARGHALGVGGHSAGMGVGVVAGPAAVHAVAPPLPPPPTPPASVTASSVARARARVSNKRLRGLVQQHMLDTPRSAPPALPSPRGGAGTPKPAGLTRKPSARSFGSMFAGAARKVIAARQVGGVGGVGASAAGSAGTPVASHHSRLRVEVPPSPSTASVASLLSPRRDESPSSTRFASLNKTIALKAVRGCCVGWGWLPAVRKVSVLCSASPRAVCVWALAWCRCTNNASPKPSSRSAWRLHRPSSKSSAAWKPPLQLSARPPRRQCSWRSGAWRPR